MRLGAGPVDIQHRLAPLEFQMDNGISGRDGGDYFDRNKGGADRTRLAPVPAHPALQQIAVDLVGLRHRRDRHAGLLASRNQLGFEFGAVLPPQWPGAGLLYRIHPEILGGVRRLG